MTPHRTLVLVAHPDLESSRITAHLTAAIKDMEHVTVHDLSAAYPDRRIDAAREQELLRTHDTIVWSFPWHWYSVPGVLKEWMDQVLTYGFAYGSGRRRPAGKAAPAGAFDRGPGSVLRGGGLQPLHDGRTPAPPGCHGTPVRAGNGRAADPALGARGGHRRTRAARCPVPGTALGRPCRRRTLSRPEILTELARRRLVK